jgi:hypothetical protein
MKGMKARQEKEEEKTKENIKIVISSILRLDWLKVVLNCFNRKFRKSLIHIKYVSSELHCALVPLLDTEMFGEQTACFL